MNGHKSSLNEKSENKSDESDEKNPVIQPGNDHDKEQQNNENNNTEEELNEQAPLAAAMISDDSNKQTTSNESNATSTRIFLGVGVSVYKENGTHILYN
ncbi:unnamed protein product [Rotaria sordida]|uniref:Uncharacterized protein n=1 Tax=Rotaria sordida TaxID=392033 RepID=A0A814CY96_9BILA|nr:unnamed protein product [Rotaria sordida]CAF0982547.1 unnamed protein product [Rotaria sordida]